AKHTTQTPRDARIHVAAVDGLASKRTEHCTIGRDERRIRSQAQALQQGNRVSRAAACRDGHRDARCLRGAERSRVALTDYLRLSRQERAVHVNRDEADWGADRSGHDFSVRATCGGADSWWSIVQLWSGFAANATPCWPRRRRRIGAQLAAARWWSG